MVKATYAWDDGSRKRPTRVADGQRLLHSTSGRLRSSEEDEGDLRGADLQLLAQKGIMFEDTLLRSQP